MPSLADTWNHVGTPKLLVLGDLILDRYTWTDAERVSPEAPVLVLRVDQEEIRPGGAASVAALLRGLDVEVILAGIVGDDRDGRLLQQILAEAGIDATLVLPDPDRPTTTKERFLGRTGGHQPHQVLRVDREVRRPLSYEQQSLLLECLSARLPECAAVLISDYAKGVCTPYLLREVIRQCQATDKPVLIDPARLPEYQRYRGATLLKPNRTELQYATGRSFGSPREAAPLARRLCQDLDIGAVVVTLDKEGMLLVTEDAVAETVSTSPQEVCDVTGAGDMSLALLGLCLASHAPLSDAVRLANIAAGLEVQKLGIAPISRREISTVLQPPSRSTHHKCVTREEAAHLATAYRQQGQTIVFTNGCFDLLHAGHITCLEEAAALGEVLIVAVNSDTSVRRLKGPTRPIIKEQDRAHMLAALACVDHVVIFAEDTPDEILLAIRPHVLVKGGTTTEIAGRALVERLGGQILGTKTLPGTSTTEILHRCCHEALLEAAQPE